LFLERRLKNLPRNALSQRPAATVASALREHPYLIVQALPGGSQRATLSRGSSSWAHTTREERNPPIASGGLIAPFVLYHRSRQNPRNKLARGLSRRLPQSVQLAPQFVSFAGSAQAPRLMHLSRPCRCKEYLTQYNVCRSLQSTVETGVSQKGPWSIIVRPPAELREP
jgi:hypothetical protein